MYKKVRSTSQSAIKTTNLNDPDLNLGDGVVAALYKRAMAAIKGTPAQMKMLLPARSDASTLSQAPPASSVVLRQPDPVQTPEPSINSPKGSTAGQDDVVEQRAAMWTSLQPTLQLPGPKAKAKAKAKTKSRGTGSKAEEEDNAKKSKCCC